MSFIYILACENRRNIGGKKMKRRILASLLSLVMTLSLLPATALAEGEIMTVSEDTEAVGKPEEVTEPHAAGWRWGKYHRDYDKWAA